MNDAPFDILSLEEALQTSNDTAGERSSMQRAPRRIDRRDDSLGPRPLPKELTEAVQTAQHNDPVNHPVHYVSHPSGVECIIITEWMNFNLGNVVKYIWRSDEKGVPIQDLEKAQWYLTREIHRRKRMLDSK